MPSRKCQGGRVEAAGRERRRCTEAVGRRIEQERASLGVRADTAAGHESAVQEHGARRVVQLRVRAGPDIFVGGDSDRLIRRRGIEAGGLVPQPRLVRPLPVAPVQNSRRVRQQHGMHERDFWQARQHLPSAAYRLLTPIERDRRTVVVAWIQRQPDRGAQFVGLGRRQPDRLLRAHQRGEPHHHVHLDVAVNQEVAAQVVLRSRACDDGADAAPSRAPATATGPAAPSVSTMNDSAGLIPRTSMVSSAKRQRCACGWKLCQFMLRSRLNTYQRISLPGMRHDRRRVADERAAVEAVGGQVRATSLDDAVLAWTVVGPDDLSADPTMTLAGAKKKSPIATFTVLGPPGCTVIDPLIDGPWMPHM